MLRARGMGLLLSLALAGAGCFAPPPVVQEQSFAASPGALRTVGVMPFYPRPDLQRALSGKERGAGQVADLVSAYFAEALAREGVRVVPPNDLVIAFTGQGHATPRLDPRAAAETAAREFGVTAVVLGEVYRWRERTGEALGTNQPASVGYQLSLYEAPGGRRLWTSRFDETQRPLSDDVRNVQRYPGGGSRWLTAPELARWGAEHAARSLVVAQWRSSN